MTRVNDGTTLTTLATLERVEGGGDGRFQFFLCVSGPVEPSSAEAQVARLAVDGEAQPAKSLNHLKMMETPN